MSITPIKIHKPTPSTHLPGHERAAAAKRRQNTALPAILGTRPPRQPKPKPHTGRKTYDTRIDSARHPFGIV